MIKTATHISRSVGRFTRTMCTYHKIQPAPVIETVVKKDDYVSQQDHVYCEEALEFWRENILESTILSNRHLSSHQHLFLGQWDNFNQTVMKHTDHVCRTHRIQTAWDKELDEADSRYTRLAGSSSTLTTSSSATYYHPDPNAISTNYSLASAHAVAKFMILTNDRNGYATVHDDGNDRYARKYSDVLASIGNKGKCEVIAKDIKRDIAVLYHPTVSSTEFMVKEHNWKQMIENGVQYVAMCGFRGEKDVTDSFGGKVNKTLMNQIYGDLLTFSLLGLSSKYVQKVKNDRSKYGAEKWQFLHDAPANVWIKEEAIVSPLFTLMGLSGASLSISPGKIVAVYSCSSPGEACSYPISDDIDNAILEHQAANPITNRH